MGKLHFCLSILVLAMIGLVFASKVVAAKDGNQVLKVMDGNGDGRISTDEWDRNPRGFKKIDGDGDGYLSLDELIGFFGGSSNGSSKSAKRNASAIQSSEPSETVWQGPIIDVHSQVDANTDLNSIVPMLDQAGVAKVILSTRFKQPSSDVLELAARHPDRIIPAAKTKTKAFTKGKGDYAGMVSAELGRHDFRAIAEVIMWHAAKKGVGAGKAAMDPDDPRVTMMLKASREKGIPFIAHVEFRAMGWDKSDYLEKLEAFIASNRDVPIGMIHMGQLDAEDAARLLPKHPNLFFITSHCNPIAYRHNNQPWTRMVVDTGFAPDWRELVLANPDRFVLAFDNVFHFHWEDTFLPQVEVWRKTLATVPDDVAHAIAHGNAERLWKLPPVK
jgi:predicted TIM-barrel fold metal-dependent hydrolase